MRFIIVCGLLFLTACAGSPFCKSLTSTPPPQGQELELFIAALDQLATSGELELMNNLQQRYPDSVWATYAETVLMQTQESSTRQEQLNNTQAENLQLLADIAVLKQENQQLSETIDQLKKLLIEQEQRPR